VEFSDFHCPFCTRVNPTIDQIFETYGDDVRVVFKQNPLPMHANAPMASAASLAAHAQGKFWEMHDMMFENQRAQTRADMDGFAEQLGLNMEQYNAFMESGEADDDIQADMALATRIAARGTPHFFVNGRRLRGAQPFPSFQTIIDEELVTTRALVESGVAAGDVYDNLMSEALAAAPAQQPAQRPQQPTAQPSDERLRVPVGDSPSKGPADALVTIVEFSDFHCPFCTRVNPTIDQLFAQYGDDIRVVFKQNPLPMHANAPMASAASLAAHAQGKFWEMHDIMFENQRAQTRADMDGFAEQLGLNMEQYNAFMESGEADAVIQADMALATQLQARGTPHFFVNGRRLRGAQPVANFQGVIDIELAEAQRIMEEEDVSRGDVYAHLMASASARAAAPTPQAQPQQPQQPTTVTPPPIGDSATKGSDDAELTIFIFSEFQCPYCSRALPTIEQIEETYGERVQLVFKSFPLPFHSDANLASQAALAAGAQGKFWEYHDILFQNQRALSRENLETYAQQLSLDMTQFQAALDSSTFAAQVDQETAEGRAVGVSGTPTFIIGNERLVGAQPFTNVQPVIERQLN
jgi:protein-disulfide isomerase